MDTIKKKKILKTSAIVAGIIAAVAIVVVILINSKIFAGENGSVVNQDIESGDVTGVDNNITTELDKETLAKKSETFLVVGLDESEMLSDVIMIVNIDYEKMNVNVLQIPRDTYVEKGTASTGKINSAYYAGDKNLTPINRLISVINDQYKIKIDHYATVNIESFRNCIDAIGGVPIDMPYSVGNNELGIIPAGEQVLDGAHAEWLVRHRHTYAEGDIGRVKVQRLFMAALVQKIKTLGVNEVVNLIPVLIGEFTTDITVKEATEYVKIAMQIDMDNIKMYILPGEGVMYNGQAVWSMHINETADMLNAYFRPYSNAVPATSLNVMELAHTGEYYENTEDSLQSILDNGQVGKKNELSTLPQYTYVLTQPPVETEETLVSLSEEEYIHYVFTYNAELGKWEGVDRGTDFTDGPYFYYYEEANDTWHMFRSIDAANRYLSENATDKSESVTTIPDTTEDTAGETNIESEEN